MLTDGPQDLNAGALLLYTFLHRIWLSCGAREEKDVNGTHPRLHVRAGLNLNSFREVSRLG